LTSRSLSLRPSPLRVAASPVVVLRRRVSLQSSMLGALLLLALASPVWAALLRCTTDEEKTLQRWHTICDDGTRAVSRYNRILER
jgi:hypothetical protein